MDWFNRNRPNTEVRDINRQINIYAKQIDIQYS